MKRNNLYISILTLVLAGISITGCEEKDIVQERPVTIRVELPSEMTDVKPDSIEVIILNKYSGISTSVLTDPNGEAKATVDDNLYSIEVRGTKTYETTDPGGNTITRRVNLTGINDNVKISPAYPSDIQIKSFIKLPGKGWVIKEIYFTGLTTPQNTSYWKDQFIEIYNNTDSLMYADGITIAATQNMTVNDVNFYAVDIDTNTYVQAVYTIPGRGTDHPVQPGNSILIANQPFNHIAAGVTNSFDLSVADFQWYDGNYQAVDVPEVENLIKYYCYTNTVWLFHTRGYHSFLIFRTDDMENLVRDYTDKRRNGAGNMITTIRIKNEWILDAVETGDKSKYNSKSLSGSLDVGFTQCDAAYSRKSVRRKVQQVINGRVEYMDTNNSTVDFIPNADPQPKKFQ